MNPYMWFSLSMLALSACGTEEEAKEKAAAPTFNSLEVWLADGETITTSSELVCVAKAVDTNQDQITLTYQWTHSDGSVLTDLDTLTLTPDSVQPGDELTCTATISTVDGTSSESLSVTVTNSLPVVDDVTIEPASGVTIETELTCSATASDADEQDIELTYTWLNGDTELATGTTLNLADTDIPAGQMITCEVFATDTSDGVSEIEENKVRIENTMPVLSSVSITPAEPNSQESLTCTAEAEDLEEDELTFSYLWTIDNAAQEETSDTLSAPLPVGSTVTCTVTVNDGVTDGTPESASVEVQNTLPVLDSVGLSPEEVYTNDVITASQVASDMDVEQSLSFTYEWHVIDASNANTDTIVQTGDIPTLDGASVDTFDRDDTVYVVVTPNDGVEDGTPLTSNSIIISNSQPLLDDPVITPNTSVFTSTELSCATTSDDVDGDTLTTTYSWTVNGSEVATGNTYIPTSSETNAGDSITCTVVVTDEAGGSSQKQASVTLENSVPLMSSVTITPATPTTQDALTCTPGATDIDDDTVTFTYEWSIDNVLQAETSNMLSPPFDVGNMITCTVTPSDGSATGLADATTVEVQNAPPVISSVLITPDTGVYNDSTLTCAATAEDEDGTPTITYSWSIDGEEVGTSASIDLSALAVELVPQPNHIVTCTATASDAANASTTSSAQVTLENRVPSAPGVTLSPTQPTAQVDDLTCSVTTNSVDADNNTVTYSFSWMVDGAPHLGSVDTPTSSTVAASSVDENQNWQCMVTPNDGIEDGPSTSASVDVPPLWSGTRTFQSCGQTGRSGPTQTQCDDSYLGSTLASEVTLTDGYQYWTVPFTGTYAIEVFGASGGDSNLQGFNAGGNGASVYGEFDLTQGEILKIVVGQQGTGVNCGGGGGGGTFVAHDNNTPLIIAGGGGGAMSCYYNATVGGDGYDGQADDTCGTDGGYGECSGNAPEAEPGGCNGEGGSSDTGASYSAGGGGGGFYTDGQQNAEDMQGIAFLNGSIGGASYGDTGDVGGFGGGAGSNNGCCGSAGGGGGYSGGGSGNECTPAGGGGSYNTGSNPSGVSGANLGDGLVTIDLL